MLTLSLNEQDQLEIRCDCSEAGGNPSDANKIVFSFNPKPPPPPAQTNTPTKQREDDDQTAFVIKVWRHKGGLIVQVGKNNFLVYAADGVSMGSYENLDGAKNMLQPKSSSPKPKPR